MSRLDALRTAPVTGRSRDLDGVLKDQGPCFVLGTGPSLAESDLAPLQGHAIIGLSSAFVHPDYARIQPRYHVLAPSHPPFRPEEVARWMRALDEARGGAVPILGATDAPLVKSSGVFGGDEYYLRFGIPWSLYAKRRHVSLGSWLPPSQSVSIIGILVALGLGARDIHLLGIDHSGLAALRNESYRHFYAEDDERVLTREPPVADLGLEFAGLARLWEQYRCLRVIAKRMSAQIKVIGASSWLDVFPRTTLREALGEP